MDRDSLVKILFLGLLNDRYAIANCNLLQIFWIVKLFISSSKLCWRVCGLTRESRQHSRGLQSFSLHHFILFFSNRFLIYIPNRNTYCIPILYGRQNKHILYLSFFLHGQNFWRIKFTPKGAGSFHIHRKTMKELGALAVLGVREQPNLAQNLVTHRHW